MVEYTFCRSTILIIYVSTGYDIFNRILSLEVFFAFSWRQTALSEFLLIFMHLLFCWVIPGLLCCLSTLRCRLFGQSYTFFRTIKALGPARTGYGCGSFRTPSLLFALRDAASERSFQLKLTASLFVVRSLVSSSKRGFTDYLTENSLWNKSFLTTLRRFILERNLCHDRLERFSFIFPFCPEANLFCVFAALLCPASLQFFLSLIFACGQLVRFVRGLSRIVTVPFCSFLQATYWLS